MINLLETFYINFEISSVVPYDFHSLHYSNSTCTVRKKPTLPIGFSRPETEGVETRNEANRVILKQH